MLPQQRICTAWLSCLIASGARAPLQRDGARGPDLKRFYIVTGDRVYHFEAASPDDCREWVRDLSALCTLVETPTPEVTSRIKSGECVVM